MKYSLKPCRVWGMRGWHVIRPPFRGELGARVIERTVVGDLSQALRALRYPEHLGVPKVGIS